MARSRDLATGKTTEGAKWKIGNDSDSKLEVLIALAKRIKRKGYFPISLPREISNIEKQGKCFISLILAFPRAITIVAQRFGGKAQPSLWKHL